MKPVLRHRFVFVAFVVLASIFGRNGASLRAEDGAQEYKLKAAFLLNFARFTSLPDEAFKNTKSPLVFCIAGKDPFGSAVSSLEAKQVNGRSIQLRYPQTIGEGEGCQIIFIPSTEKDRMEEFIGFCKDKPVISVSDIDGFAAKGGIFEFRNTADHLSFVINNKAAKEKGIRISSSLLSLALEVY
jgi:hypothetical protein